MNFTIDPEMIKNLQPLVISYTGKAVAALLIFLIGKWIARKITNVLIRLMKVRSVDLTLIKFLEGILYYALLTSVIIAAAGQLGIKTTSFLAVLGAASLAIGLALKDSLANFSSGIMLILFRPFKVGDVVTVGGESGKVEAISVFSTILNTGDNQKKIIPNGAISNATITNITANPTRRVDLVVGIGYDDDILEAKTTLEEIMAADNRILASPAPVVAVSALGASSVDLVVRPWVKTEDYWDVYFSLNEKIKLTFDEKGISFPYPQQDVHLFQTTQ
ncbi:mechanosensitive ion channel family protein [Desulforhopalus sp. IMCC35007]|uniref:mechanosensitive ion channel family protein n=1 Tax=Desulforhopalus sp. IMCC35007 TaxID=2569543 RepID=UPI0010AECBB4|nr:mechanosensitive ion channel domain-containing protein [Desulforhopalus sp. IMCC35007]TKB08355.1 mechanosensitive ion channel [Desulforhopalus sp. IMCC35007]